MHTYVEKLFFGTIFIDGHSINATRKRLALYRSLTDDVVSVPQYWGFLVSNFHFLLQSPSFLRASRFVSDVVYNLQVKFIPTENVTF